MTRLTLPLCLSLCTLAMACKDDEEQVEPAEPVLLGPPYNIGFDSISLSWLESSISSFDRYELYRSEEADVSLDDTLVAELYDRTETSFPDEGLQTYHQYFYRVWVFNSVEDNAPSNEVSATTDYDTAPAGLVLEEPTDISATEMTLSWQASQASDFAYYRLYRAESEDVDQAATLVYTTAEQHVLDRTDTGLTPNTTYYYRVYVEDEWGISTGSNVVSGTTLNTEAPLCDIAASHGFRPVGENFSFSAIDCYDQQTPTEELEVSWDFGDGSGWTEYSTDKTTSHDYVARGAYQVTLEVSDDTYASTTSTWVVAGKLIELEAGSYYMGRESDSTPWPESEPQRLVVLTSDFDVDQYEVDVASYAAFLSSAGGALGYYSTQMEIAEAADGIYTPHHGHEDRPITGVSWYDAEAYCSWASRWLPTEAQWEAAARGPSTGPNYEYPWGDDLPASLTPTPANYGKEIGEVVDVDEFEEGVTAWDADRAFYQLAGNADEWVADYYDPDYYQWANENDANTDPTGPDTSPYADEGEEYRVTRGGSWCNDENPLRVSFRCYADPWGRGNARGFRCAGLPATMESVSAGGRHSCSLDSDGWVACWGDNSDGQTEEPSEAFTDISAGEAHTCGVTVNGSLRCWGNDDAGQSTPPSGSFTQVSAGYDHSCAVDDTGAVSCWGADDQGQSTPPQGSFTQVSAGDWNSCAIGSSGTVYCWGGDSYGESTPPGGSFVQVSAGHYHSCAVDGKGGVQCWGSDDDGESTPLSGSYSHVSAGQSHTCGLETTGGVRCWGADHYHQASPPKDGFVQLSAGAQHNCGIDSVGGILCWGWDQYQQSSP